MAVTYEIVPYEERKWIIYVHTNKSNNKKYIGQTSQDPEKRWGANGCNYVNSPSFYNAIQKYGWDNFEHIIMFNNLTHKEANFWEIELIKLFKTSNKQYGYNLSKGGTGGNQKDLKPVKQYDLYGNFIKEYKSVSQAAIELGTHRTHITRACKKHGTTKGYMWCYVEDEINHPYKRNGQKTVIQKTLYDEFIAEYISLADAARQTGIGRDNIHRCISNKNSHAGGYHWCYRN